MTTTSKKTTEAASRRQPDNSTLSVATSKRANLLRILTGRRDDAVSTFERTAISMQGVARDREMGKMMLDGINALEEEILELSALEGRALADRFCAGWDPEPMPAGVANLNLADFLRRGAR
jgi:hypothetical protein